MVGCLCHVPFVSLFAALATIHVAHAIEFAVINKAEATEGGKLFDEKLGIEGAKKLMTLAPSNIRTLALGQDFGAKKHVKQITLVIFGEMDEISSYHQTDEVNGLYEIHLHASHFVVCSSFLKKEITMLIYYELSHIFQWTAKDDVAAKELIDGIAAFVVLRTACKPERWINYGGGFRWDESLDVTAQFLVYCNREFPEFVIKLNNKMETSYSPRYFVELTEKTIDELWHDYETNSATNE